MVKVTKKAQPAIATISQEMKSDGKIVAESTTDEKVQVDEGVTSGLKIGVVPNDVFCTVKVEASYTHNLGNYKSGKVGVAISIPCKHSEIEPVFAWADKWVETKMDKMRDELINSSAA